MRRCIGERDTCGGHSRKIRKNDDDEKQVLGAPISGKPPVDVFAEQALLVQRLDERLKQMQINYQQDMLRVQKQCALLHQRLVFYDGLPIVDRRTVTFNPGNLGFLVDWSSGGSIQVSREGQAQHAGLTGGWYLDRIEGVVAGQDDVDMYSRGNDDFSITFKRAAAVSPHTPSAGVDLILEPTVGSIDGLAFEFCADKRLTDIEAQLQALDQQIQTVGLLQVSDAIKRFPVEDEEATSAGEPGCRKLQVNDAFDGNDEIPSDESPSVFGALFSPAHTAPLPTLVTLLPCRQEVLSTPADAGEVSSTENKVCNFEKQVAELQEAHTQMRIDIEKLGNAAHHDPLKDKQSEHEDTKSDHNQSDDQTQVVQSDDQTQLVQTVSSLRMSNQKTLDFLHKHGTTYQVKESVWDLGILIGTKEVEIGGSIFSFILLVMNVVMQFAFCAIINDTFTTETIGSDEVSDLKRWRTLSAHDMTWIDPISHHSLARRVCDLDGSLPMSSGITEQLALINSYLPIPGDEGNQPAIGYMFPQFEGIGRLLCVLALVVWYLTLSKDIADIGDLFMALWTLKSEAKTRIEETESGTTMEAVTAKRKCFVAIVLMLRLVVVAVLAFCGTLFLTYTISMADIFLNAVALDIVFGLDELIFEALAPTQIRKLLEILEPFPCGTQPSRLKGLNCRPVVFLLAIVSMVTCATIVVLEPQVDHLRDARDAICGGNIGFVATVNKFGVVVAASDVVGDEDSSNYDTTYVFKAFEELIRSPNDAALRDSFGDSHSLSAISVGLQGAVLSLAGNADMSVAEATGFWNNGCTDLGKLAIYQSVLADAVKPGASRVSCTDAKAFCNHDSVAGVRSRQICPETCGCRDPLSSLVLNSISQGCPHTCMASTDFRNALLKHSCEVDAGKNDVRFQRFLQGLAEFRDSYPVSWQGLVEQIITELKNNGCQALVVGGFIPKGGSWPIDFCAEDNTYSLKPLRYMCPLTCECQKAKSKYLCPGNCTDLFR